MRDALGPIVCTLAVALATCLPAGVAAAREQTPVPDAEPVRRAAAAYAQAFNARDFAALAEQWTQNAELFEGGMRVAGRDAIVGSLRAGLQRHPQATMAIEIADVQFVAASLARVSGVMKLTRKPGEKPFAARFVSVRLLEEGVWRLAESSVTGSHAAALDAFDWLVGTWQATGPGGDGAVETRIEKALSGHAIVVRSTIRPKSGDAIESIALIHADRDTGAVRSWTFDSTGARAEGVFTTDGTTIDCTLVGTAADAAGGHRAEWVRAIAPTGDGRFTQQSIERTIDGRPIPDGEPLHFKKIR